MGTWVVGSGWDLNKWDDPSCPDPTLLDARGARPSRGDVVPRPAHPVADAYALEIAGGSTEHRRSLGGSFIRDDDGQLTGLVREDATDLVARFIPELSREEQVEHIAVTQKLFLSQGLTGIHELRRHRLDAGMPNDLREADRQDMRGHATSCADPKCRGRSKPAGTPATETTGCREAGSNSSPTARSAPTPAHMSSPFPETDGEAENSASAHR